MRLLLAQAGQIGPLQLKNRVIMGPMGSNYGISDGSPSERDKLYYSERARGGVAMIITESMAISEKARNHNHATGAYHDRFIPGLARLVDAIHENGALAVGQLGHRGGLLRRSVLNMEPVGPSPWANPNTGDPVRELRVDEILGIQHDFATAAVRLQRAGFDAVEIHAANGYLFQQFLSPRINGRTDEYGGSLENRMRFLLETVAMLRQHAPRFPLIVRISATEYAEGGYTEAEVIELSRALEREGVAAISLSGGSNESPALSRYCIQPPSMPRACLVPFAAPIKRAVSIPVIMGGRIVEPADAESVLAEGAADFVAVGRALRADAYWFRKATGEIGTPIRQCLSCNVCFERLTRELDVSCAQNPLVGTEFERLEYAEPQAARALKGETLNSINRKRVLVLGAGAAGAEAARVLAANGHHVEIWERASEAGGQTRVAVVPPYKQEVKGVWTYRETQLRELGVPIRTGVAATAEAIRRFGPDVVVVATGSSPAMPEALRSSEVPTVAAWDVLARPDRIADGAAVTIIGGGSVGLETAELLTGKGCRVSVLEMLPTLAPEMPRNNRTDLLLRLAEAGVATMTGARVDSIKGPELVVAVNGEQRTLEIGDCLVIALGVRRNLEIVPVLEEVGVPFVLVGDCNTPGDFRTGLRDALLAAISIEYDTRQS